MMLLPTSDSDGLDTGRFRLEASEDVITRTSAPLNSKLGASLHLTLAWLFPGQEREISRIVSRTISSHQRRQGYVILRRGNPANDWLVYVRNPPGETRSIIVSGKRLLTEAAEDFLVSSAKWLLDRYGSGLHLRFWHTDASHRFTTVTDAPGSEQLRPEASSMVGRTRWECAGVSDPAVDPKWRAHLAELDAGRQVQDFAYRVTDENGKSTIWSVTATPVHDSSGRLQGYQGHSLDVTELWITRSYLRQSYEGIRRLIDDLPTPVLLWSEDWRLLHMSRSAVASIGISKEILLGKSVCEITKLLQLEITGEPCTNAPRHPDGIIFSKQDASGNESMWRQTVLGELSWHENQRVCAYVDITNAREQLEAQQRREQADNIGQFAASLAHDLSNIMAVISGAVQSVRSGDEAEIAEALDDVSNMLATSQEMILGLRGIATGSKEGIASRLDLIPTMQRYVRSLNRSDGPRVGLSWTVASAEVDVDPLALERAALNLIVNAREAAGVTGKVRITVGSTERAGRTYATITVDDDGAGFPDDVRRRVGQPMLSTKEGTARGFGLAQVHAFVTRFSGDLEISTSAWGGGRITLSLPAKRSLQPHGPGSDNDKEAEQDTLGDAPGTTSDTGRAAEEPAEVDRPLALIIDDYRPVRNMVARAFEQLGWATRQASSAREALLSIDQAGQPMPDLVLTDAVMPGMSGHELVQVLQERYANLPVILMSGHVPSGRSNDSPFLQKPFSIADLSKALVAAGLDAEPPLRSSAS